MRFECLPKSSSLTMPDLHFEVLPKKQFQLWQKLQSEAPALGNLGFYLAGGTALALQIGHRQSLDFDFFSQQPNTAEPVSDWLTHFPDFLIRETAPDIVHAEIDRVKVSFIGHYKYPLVEKSPPLGKLSAAGILDIGLMKLLAVTHRATLRDYLDLAVILRDHLALSKLLEASSQKYGGHFNVMICLKALVSFQDVDQEMPILLDKSVQDSWQKILTDAVKQASR